MSNEPKTPEIVILTGAGISSESGIPTFRAADGLWEKHRVEDVATPEAFARNPGLVQRFYNQRRQHLLDDSVQPNAAHRALGRLQQNLGAKCLLVTQNIDDLHDRVNTSHLLHLHGELLKSHCTSCGFCQTQHEDLATDLKCPGCGATRTLRPDIVWFGEMPRFLDQIYIALANCRVFVAIGTSGHVYPASGFVQVARESGARCIEINLQASEVSTQFDEHRVGKASEQMPLWVSEILARE